MSAVGTRTIDSLRKSRITLNFGLFKMCKQALTSETMVPKSEGHQRREIGDNYDNAKKKPIKYALPPWHSVVTVAILATLFVSTLPSATQLQSEAKVEKFTRILFPQLMPSLWHLFVFRASVAAMIFSTSFYLVWICEGWTQTPIWPATSKLIIHEIELRGLKTMFPFTSVSWNLLGFSFSINAYITYQTIIHGDSVELPPRLLCLALLLWECAAPFTLLVASVIRFVIWPKALSVEGATTENLKTWRNILMHNVNVWLALTETALVSGLSPIPSHIGVAPLVGSVYVLFSWSIANTWVKPFEKYGPQFIYFFLDTTLPGGRPTYALLALMSVLMVFYGIFAAADAVLTTVGSSLWSHVLAVVLVGSSVSRFRD